MATRIRRPRKAKPGELKMEWGRLPHDKPDLCYSWGEGVSKSDAHLLQGAFTYVKVLDASLLAELEARGYDLATLKFSVRKKQ